MFDNRYFKLTNNTNDSLLDTKKTNWKTTVQQWKIERAFFLSYNPVSKTRKKPEIINKILAQTQSSATTTRVTTENFN